MVCWQAISGHSFLNPACDTDSTHLLKQSALGWKAQLLLGLPVPTWVPRHSEHTVVPDNPPLCLAPSDSNHHSCDAGP